jgi:transcriptional regulator with XRE-family HTH domain
MTTKKYYGIERLQAEFGPMTVGLFLRAFREADGLSQAQFGKKLKLSRANVCDIEKGRKQISLSRAVHFAKCLGVPDEVMISLAIEDALRAAKLKYSIELKKIG